MAYISQQDKKALAPAIKAVLKTYGVKGTLSIEHRNTLIITISSGPLSLVDYANADKKYGSATPVITYHDKGESPVSGYEREQQFVDELIGAMQGEGWFHESDLMSDYFQISYYIKLRIGKWDKPYQCTSEEIEPPIEGASKCSHSQSEEDWKRELQAKKDQRCNFLDMDSNPDYS